MHTEETTMTVIVVCAEPGIERKTVTRTITVRCVHSIKAAIALLDSAPSETVLITELALRDGNWRDLIEEVGRLGKSIPVALVSPTSTSELWWDALGCGVEDILPTPLTVASIREYLEKQCPTRGVNRSLR
jgi:DNA-binding NtrC family response regulator